MSVTQSVFRKPISTVSASVLESAPQIRYAQCWEDADILLAGLQVRTGDVCLSIASGGENSLSLLSGSPSKVVAVDCNPSQLACLELKAAAFRNLTHEEMLRFLGSQPATAAERREAYTFCAPDLAPATARYWRENLHLLEAGINSGGKFENYFRMFRQLLLPLIHNANTVEELCAVKSLEAQRTFYLNVWNTWRWRALFKMFFSRQVMGNAGRDPQLFKYVEGDVSARILDRVAHGLTEVSPSENPYLQWILFGEHRTALPHALRAENFASIRANLNNLQLQCVTVDEYLAQHPETHIDCFNLSDIFEYMNENEYVAMLDRLAASSSDGARLAYWNMLVYRHAPTEMTDIIAHKQTAKELLAKDKAFFYSDFVVEEVRKQ